MTFTNPLQYYNTQITVYNQGGPRMLKIARGRQIFLWRRGVPPSPPFFPKMDMSDRKRKFQKKHMKIS